MSKKVLDHHWEEIQISEPALKELTDKDIALDQKSGNSDDISIVSIVCRICFDDNKDEPIITPCLCRGSVAFVHTSCLEKWLAESKNNACELCHHVYETEKVPKYTAAKSIWHWFRLSRSPNPNVSNNLRPRQIRCDLIACTILTPLAVIVTYVCLFSADYYNQQRYATVPAARWTSLSLLVLIVIMLFGYYLWVYVVVGYHGRMWFYWWQREWVVRYVQPTIHNSHQIDEMLTPTMIAGSDIAAEGYSSTSSPRSGSIIDEPTSHDVVLQVHSSQDQNPEFPSLDPDAPSYSGCNGKGV